MKSVNRSTGRPDSGGLAPTDGVNSIDEGRSALAIACTLGIRDLQVRLADIRDLAFRSLRRSRREGSVLHLTYDREVLAEVEKLVARESDCCAFLEFDVARDETGVHVTITAPAAIADAADELFSHFTPGLLLDGHD
jgi:hypothetical protein